MADVTVWRVVAVALVLVCLLHAVLTCVFGRRPRRRWGWEIWGSAETRRARRDWRSLPREIRDAILGSAARGEPELDPSTRAVAIAWADAQTAPRWPLAWIGEAVPYFLGWSAGGICLSLVAGRDPTGYLVGGAIGLAIASTPRLGWRRWRARRVLLANGAPDLSDSRTVKASP